MRILIIDPNVSSSSPSLKALVRSVPELSERGFQFEAWSWHVDADLPVKQTKKLSRLLDLPVIGGLWFMLQARLHYWWDFKFKKKARPDLVFTVASYEPECDICLVQFSPFDWQKRQNDLGIKSLRDWVLWFQNQMDLFVAKHFYRRTRANTVLCVSTAVKNDLQHENSALNLQLLPNSYDPERFNLTVRESKRNEMRASLGFTDEHVVFVFASTGHYRRKGFHLASEALKILSIDYPNVRLLIIGGQEKRIQALQSELDDVFPNWKQFMVFTGMVSDMPAYLAAGDGFLFPSYSEAFALVEVEAAAMGLPLFLTRHHGSEMILRDCENGLFLDFDPSCIAKTLTAFINGNWKPTVNDRPEGALDSLSYTEKLGDYLIESHRLKKPISQPV